ncbi:conserved hypothetical protein [Histoplasma capsulatum G186AR]|uniref:P-loop containing nucleoside triphosphate hydrolase protein n=1 Tax=Ajellomyces capsulatus (strain G186AR / H82 / ATCC MYA-2454 / RMSCC 2432) TaxID=447093 RepID=C0NKY4_AJECG|nr:uncharacterized protein HCBG_03814 [Histoplasma capsulatum G186AR]EEH08525.1 conserved hypothetical protein [Histoplasma capsulatum G186AR]
MSNRPIFVATHPRACSTAFERVFMQRRDTLQCVHEPFGDAFYFGPERMSRRYEGDEKARVESGFAHSTYQSIFERLEREAAEGKRLFIKDIIHYLVPPSGQPPSIAPSLLKIKRGVGTQDGNVVDPVSILAAEPSSNVNKKTPYPYDTPAEVDNPTVVPAAMLGKFHFTFLIRDPHYSIPSYYRCTIPPLDAITGFYDFYESEAGYDEVRRVFDYLRKIRLVGPHDANGNATTNGASNGVYVNGDGVNGSAAPANTKRAEICVIDADDLLDDPAGIIKRYCKSVGIDYTPEMLTWNSEEDHEIAKEAFEKWRGFHEDAIHSTELKARNHQKARKTEAEFDQEWREKYGEKGAKIIRAAVDRNMADYRYMKKFVMKA